MWCTMILFELFSKCKRLQIKFWAFHFMTNTCLLVYCYVSQWLEQKHCKISCLAGYEWKRERETCTAGLHGGRSGWNPSYTVMCMYACVCVHMYGTTVAWVGCDHNQIATGSPVSAPALIYLPPPKAEEREADEAEEMLLKWTPW